MKERPILFSGAMVRALLAGTKTQTRRPVKPQPDIAHWQAPQMMSPKGGRARFRSVGPDWPDGDEDDVYCPYGQPGDRLWVRESFGYVPTCCEGEERVFAADYTDGSDIAAGVRYRPSIHMPRAASRILLEVTSIRVERLQAISRGDAMAEGCPFANMAEGSDPRAWYAELWDQINGAGSWASNPWVWVVDFKPIDGSVKP